jgi:hypothetical protein
MAGSSKKTAFEPDEKSIHEILERRARLLSEVAAQETGREEVVNASDPVT